MKKTWRKYEVSPRFHEETMKLNLAQLANNLQVEPNNMKFLEKNFFGVGKVREKQKDWRSAPVLNCKDDSTPDLHGLLQAEEFLQAAVNTAEAAWSWRSKGKAFGK